MFFLNMESDMNALSYNTYRWIITFSLIFSKVRGEADFELNKIPQRGRTWRFWSIFQRKFRGAEPKIAIFWAEIPGRTFTLHWVNIWNILVSQLATSMSLSIVLTWWFESSSSRLCDHIAFTNESLTKSLHQMLKCHLPMKC